MNDVGKGCTVAGRECPRSADLVTAICQRSFHECSGRIVISRLLSVVRHRFSIDLPDVDCFSASVVTLPVGTKNVSGVTSAQDSDTELMVARKASNNFQDSCVNVSLKEILDRGIGKSDVIVFQHLSHELTRRL